MNSLANPRDILALDSALEELSRISERQARLVEGRFFGGLEISELAELLGVPEADGFAGMAIGEGLAGGPNQAIFRRLIKRAVFRVARSVRGKEQAGMDERRWQQIQEIFARTVELPLDAQRAAVAKKSAEGDESLKAKARRSAGHARRGSPQSQPLLDSRPG